MSPRVVMIAANPAWSVFLPPPSAQVVGAERVALSRVAGGVAGAEPALPLVGGAVREGVLVHRAAAQVLLDEVVADPAGGVQRPGDVVVGDVGDQRLAGLVGHGLGMVGPGAGVAVGLQLQPHAAAGGAGLTGGDPLVGAEQVLHVVAVLVGQHVGVDERATFGAEPGLQVVEEAQVDVDQLVARAVEGPRAAGRATAGGLHGAGEEHRVGGLVGGAQRLAPVVLDRVDVGDDRALDGVVRVADRLAGLLQRGVVGGLARP